MIHTDGTPTIAHPPRPRELKPRDASAGRFPADPGMAPPHPGPRPDPGANNPPRHGDPVRGEVPGELIDPDDAHTVPEPDTFAEHDRQHAAIARELNR